MSEQTQPDMNEGASPGEVCPNCETSRVRVQSRKIEFLHGIGSHVTTLSAVVPMHVCGECGAEFTDDVAEKLRHAAVCRHLGLLTPEQIVAIRERAGMSRKQFAAMTRIGMASLSRWENSEGMQNPALDLYLRLLARPEGIKVLREVLSVEPAAERQMTAIADAPPKKFGTLAKFEPARRARLTRQATDFRFCMTG